MSKNTAESRYFDPKEGAPQEELWDFVMHKYQSPVAKYLYNGLFQAVTSLIKSHVPATGKILEVGCGPAESTIRIKQILPEYHLEASDFDPRYVDKIKQMYPEIPVKQESVDELQRQDNEFDCLLFLEVMEHLEYPEKALAELFRVSKKYVVISVPHEPLWRVLNMARGKYIKLLGNTPGHINHFSASSLKKIVSKYGKVVQLNMPIPWLVLLAEKNEG